VLVNSGMRRWVNEPQPGRHACGHCGIKKTDQQRKSTPHPYTPTKRRLVTLLTIPLNACVYATGLQPDDLLGLRRVQVRCLNPTTVIDSLERPRGVR